MCFYSTYVQYNLYCTFGALAPKAGTTAAPFSGLNRPRPGQPIWPKKVLRWYLLLCPYAKTWHMDV